MAVAARYLILAIVQLLSGCINNAPKKLHYEIEQVSASFNLLWVSKSSDVFGIRSPRARESAEGLASTLPDKNLGGRPPAISDCSLLYTFAFIFLAPWACFFVRRDCVASSVFWCA